MTRLYDELENGLDVDRDPSEDTLLSPTHSRIAEDLAWWISHRQNRVRGAGANQDMKEEDLDSLFATFDLHIAIDNSGRKTPIIRRSHRRRGR